MLKFEDHLVKINLFERKNLLRGDKKISGDMIFVYFEFNSTKKKTRFF